MRRSSEVGLGLTCLLGSADGIVSVHTFVLGFTLSLTISFDWRLLERSTESCFFRFGRYKGINTMEDRSGLMGLEGKCLGMGSKAVEYMLTKEFVRIGKDRRAV
jgi:hypothetical protein